MVMRLFLVFYGSLAALGCSPDPAAVRDVAAYEHDIASWHAARADRLMGAEGWLNLTGLYWLKDGANTFGSGVAEDIVLPADRAPIHAGEFVLRDDRVTVRVSPGVEINSTGLPVEELRLRDDEEGDPTILTHGTLALFAIKRMDRIGIRVRDYEHPSLAVFPGIETYPVATTWRIVAELKPYPEPRHVAVNTVVEGLGWDPIALGVVEFELHGERQSLEVLESGDEYFILFADTTNGLETYPAGRFLYAEPVDKDGLTVLDFNIAYNPPCAFNDFATCPLPPRQNHLDIPIPAGEKFSEALHVPAI